MSATALLLAKADPKAADWMDDMQSSVVSQERSILTSQTQQQRASELDNLVAAGDWKGVLMAVSQYEGASDTESFALSILEEHRVTTSDYRSEVEALVRSVVPGEIGKQ